MAIAAFAALALALMPTLTASAAKTTAQAAGVSTTSAGDRQAAANKALVVYFQDQLWNDGNLSVIDKYVSPGYVQHNPTAGNGPDPLRQLVTEVRSAFPQLHITIVRAVAEGDLVVLQENGASVPGGPGQANFDMYRVENGKVVEHWDVLQNEPASTVSGNDMLSQLSTPSGNAAPAAVTARDKGIALDYVTSLMQDHDLSAIGQYVAPSLYQHDPTLANGSAALEQSYSSLFAQYPSFNVHVAQVTPRATWSPCTSTSRTRRRIWARPCSTSTVSGTGRSWSSGTRSRTCQRPQLTTTRCSSGALAARRRQPQPRPARRGGALTRCPARPER
jgi:predicted SnoaL-like aldol condensation-catalyzing enzyme